MRHAFLDKWSRLDSPVHRLPAAAKLALALASVLALVSVPRSWVWFFAAFALGLVLVAGASRIPPGFLLRRLVLLEPFVLGVALLSFMQPHGFGLALWIVVRSTFSLTTMILLTNTTRFSDLLLVLRRARMPALLVTTMALM